MSIEWPLGGSVTVEGGTPLERDGVTLRMPYVVRCDGCRFSLVIDADLPSGYAIAEKLRVHLESSPDCRRPWAVSAPVRVS